MLVTSGCVEGGAPAYDSYCHALCDLERTCQATVDVPTTPATLRQCQRECMSDPRVTQSRAAVLDLAGSCLSERECSTDTQGAAATLRWARETAAAACTAEALDDADSTESCERYCDQLVAALEDCDVTESEAECRARVCRFEPEAFEGDTCLSLNSDDECEALSECVATGLP